jgi:site-specific DNA recombinase
MYRYYRCVHAIKAGQDTCTTGSLPALEIERMVVDEIKGLAKDETLLTQVLDEAHNAIHADLLAAEQECDDLRQQHNRHEKELRSLAVNGKTDQGTTERIASLHEQLAEIGRVLPDTKARIADLKRQTVTPTEARLVFEYFDVLWSNLVPREQIRLLNLLIAKVEYDGKAGTISVTFRPTSIRTLINQKLQEAA